jgi:hypothetical protein
MEAENVLLVFVLLLDRMIDEGLSDVYQARIVARTEQAGRSVMDTAIAEETKARTTVAVVNFMMTNR